MTSRRVLFHATLILVSVVFLYFLSYSTSPRYSTFGDDSTIFQAVGKCWAEGLLPYVGAFENKGPLLFAIDAIGYLIYPRVGIVLLQIPFMYFSLLFAWRAVELFWSQRATFAIWLFMIFWRASIFYEGNRTEEYSMPFLMAATYFFLRGLKEEKFSCPPLVGFVYGLGFGACVLLRTTNGLPICCYVLLTMIFLIHAGELKNLWQNVLHFCAGFAIIILPFVIYFAAHDALYDMIYGTILLNINHATGYNLTAKEFLDVMIPHALVRFTILFWLPITSLFAIGFNCKSKLAWSGLVTGSAMLFLLLKSRPFYGYPELILSMLPLLFAVIHELKETLLPMLNKIWSIRGLSPKRIFCKVLVISFVFIFVVTIVIQCISFKRVFNTVDNEIGRASFSNFSSIIPATEQNSVVMWGESLSMGRFILETGIKPRCRFFGNVEMFFGKSDPAVIDEWIQNVQSDYPKWIVYGALEKEYTGEKMSHFEYNFRRQRNLRVEEILSEKYIFTDEVELYGQIVKLYRLRE